MVKQLTAMIAGALGLLLLLELILRALPVSSATARDYYQDPLILSYPAGHRWRVATGWDLRNPQVLEANNLGFASDIDFRPDPAAVALIGDSYVESSMLDAPNRPGPQLAAALGGRRAVYAFGAPGSALLDYAERIRLASATLGVREFVVFIEAGDLRQSLCGSGNVHGPCLDSKTLQPRTQKLPPPSTLKRIVSRSALAQYLVGQLKLDGPRLLEKFMTIEIAGAADARARPPARVGEPPEVTTQRERMVQAVADAFFDRIQPYPIDRLVIVAVGHRDKPGPVDEPPAPDALACERQQFMRIASERGVRVVDTDPVFRQHWQHSDLALTVGPYDGHLNAIGVRLAMQAAAQALR